MQDFVCFGVAFTCNIKPWQKILNQHERRLSCNFFYSCLLDDQNTSKTSCWEITPTVNFASTGNSLNTLESLESHTVMLSGPDVFCVFQTFPGLWAKICMSMETYPLAESLQQLVPLMNSSSVVELLLWKPSKTNWDVPSADLPDWEQRCSDTLCSGDKQKSYQCTSSDQSVCLVNS